ncbi:MAG TPA: hypothetical protein VI565_05485, partial [Burkholderiales bacterium]|nr:hypothetical protein [Burkholderiales bacterium]
ALAVIGAFGAGLPSAGAWALESSIRDAIEDADVGAVTQCLSSTPTKLCCEKESYENDHHSHHAEYCTATVNENGHTLCVGSHDVWDSTYNDPSHPSETVHDEGCNHEI